MPVELGIWAQVPKSLVCTEKAEAVALLENALAKQTAPGTPLFSTATVMVIYPKRYVRGCSKSSIREILSL